MDTTCRLWYNQGPAEFYAGGPSPRSPTYKGFKGEEYAMSAIKVIKRDGTIVDYDRSKIKLAIQKANAEVPEEDRIQEARTPSSTASRPAGASACWWRTSRTWWSRPW